MNLKTHWFGNFAGKAMVRTGILRKINKTLLNYKIYKDKDFYLAIGEGLYSMKQLKNEVGESLIFTLSFRMLATKLWYIKAVIKNMKDAKMVRFIKIFDQQC